jgi:glycosyltransferase involved in cell wall biosynthesis
MTSLTPLKPAITVFIPVYNGSQFLLETLNNILEQSLSNFEILCVDDTSTDNSYQILQDVALRDARLRIFQKPNGGSAAKSFNFALPYMHGEYIFYTSQDDLMAKDLLEKMYSRAKETDADGVLPHMVACEDQEKKCKDISVPVDKIISGREAASLSIDWLIHGFVLWKKSLVQKIRYYEFGLYSDEYTVRVLFLNSKKIAFCDSIFYYRQNNPNAVTKKLSLSWFDKLETNERLWDLFQEHAITPEDKKKLIKVSFMDLFHFQAQFVEKKQKLSSSHRIVVKNKIKLAYNNFKNINKIPSSFITRFFCTKGYTIFSFYVWTYVNLKKLILRR